MSRGFEGSRGRFEGSEGGHENTSPGLSNSGNSLGGSGANLGNSGGDFDVHGGGFQGSGSVSPNGYEFTINGTAVTAEQRVIGTSIYNLNLPSNATFVAGAGTVTETLTGTNATEVTTFTQDATNTAVYHITSVDETVTNPTTTTSNGGANGYSFTISNGSVTGIQSVFGHGNYTRTVSELIPVAGSSYAVSGNTVTQTSVHDNVVETLQYVQSGSAGLYAIASDNQTFILPGSSTTLLSVNAGDREKFTFDALSNVTQVQHVSQDGTVTTATLGSNVSYSQLAAGYVLETVTNGTQSHYDVYHDGNGDGIYTSIAHGAGTAATVDLVGLQSQLTSTIHGLT